MSELNLGNNDVQLVRNEEVPGKRRRVSNDSNEIDQNEHLNDELRLKVRELEEARAEINNLKAQHAKELEKFASMEKSYKRIEILFNGSATKIFKLEQENSILKKELNSLKQTERERILMQLKANERLSESTSQSISNEQLETFIEKGREHVEHINKQKSTKTSVNEQLKKIIAEHKNSSNKAKNSKDYIGALEKIYICIGIQLNSLVDKNQLSSLWNSAGQIFVEMNNITKEFECYDNAMTISPLLHSSYNNRADLYLKFGYYDNAKRNAEKALKVTKNNKHAQQILDEIEARTKSLDD